MKNFLRLYRSSEGQGNIGYDDAPTTPAATPLTGANDGLSKDAATGTIAQLGQTLARAGNPAALLEDREIPMGGHRLFLTDASGNLIGFDANQGVSVFNDTGQAYQGLWQIAGNTAQWQLFTDDAVDVVEKFTAGAGSSQIVWNGNQVDPLKWVPDSPWIFGSGIGQIPTPIAAAGGGSVVNLTQAQSFILADTTLGALQINISVVANTLRFQRFIVKKVSADVNNVTLNMVVGTIQAIGAPAATLVFNTQGESIEFICDGVNAYVI